MTLVLRVFDVLLSDRKTKNLCTWLRMSPHGSLSSNYQYTNVPALQIPLLPPHWLYGTQPQTPNPSPPNFCSIKSGQMPLTLLEI